MAVVKIAPTGWTNTGDGVGVFSAYFDSDNLTVWVFQLFSSGFARARYDGTFIVQGNIFNNTSLFLDIHERGSVMFVQDDIGHYYTVFTNASGQTLLYKSHVAPGPTNNIWNGYMTVDATVQLASAATPTFAVEGWNTPIVPASDGNRYLFLCCNDSLHAPTGSLVAVNVDTMTVVGNYTANFSTSPPQVSNSFMDKFGDFWALVTPQASDVAQYLVRWHPADGATGGVLNVTSNRVTKATLGFSVSGSLCYAAYNPTNHSVIIGDNDAARGTGEMCVIDLTAFSRNVFAADNHTNLYGFGLDAPEAAFMLNVASNGLLALPGDTNLTSQFGGILNVFNPATLSLLQSFNITTIINTAIPGSIPQTTSSLFYSHVPTLPGFSMMKYNSSVGKVLVAYDTGANPTTTLPAFLVDVNIVLPTLPATLGLTAVRNYCQAYGIFISGVMDTQRYAKDWLTELCQVANCAPVWNGAMLNFIPRCEQSKAGNGVVFTAPTASGPVADLDDNVFIYRSGNPPVTITRTRPADAYNVLPIEHINRQDNYNRAITTVRDDADIFKRGAIKASTLQLHWIHDQATAVKVGWPLVRRSTIVERLTFGFALPKTFSWLDPYDLVTLTDTFIGLQKFPVRLTSIKENQNYELECQAEPFFYGVHAPTPTLPGSVPITTSFNQNQQPGSVNTPVIFEAVARLNQFQNQGAIWITASGAGSQYGGCAVFLSVDGGVTYGTAPIGIINGNPIVGVTFADFPVGVDPDNVDTLSVDISESFGQQLANFTASQMNAFASLFYLAGGGNVVQNGQNLVIPYELLAYETANLISGGQYNIVPPTRRGVYGTPIVDHPIGTQFLFIDTSLIIQFPLDPALIGQTLFFKFAAFNLFGQEQQDLSVVTAYQFTPTGKVGGSQIVNQNQNYTLTPSQVVFQGKAGGIPGHPTFTDPTKLYVITPFTANFASGPITYAGPYGPVAIPGVAPETLYVSVQDPQHTGTGTLFVDQTATNFNSSGFTKLAQLFIPDTVTGGAQQQTATRNMYGMTPAPNGTNQIFIIKAFPPVPYVDVYVNGVLQDPSTHYTLLGNQVTFTQAPQTGDDLEAVF